MKLPAYPVATVDPHFSIWSAEDEINKADTKLWYGIKKRIEGHISVDGELFRFLGGSDGQPLFQTKTEIAPYISSYTFENQKIRLIFRSYSPFLFKDLSLLALPVAFLDTEVISLDGKEHSLCVSFRAYDELCYADKIKPLNKYTDSLEGRGIAKMGCLYQKPLNDSGDEFCADWGYYLFMGGECSVSKKGIEARSELYKGKKLSYTAIIGYDDTFSINYFGDKLKGLWTERFSCIEAGMKYCLENKREILSALREQGDMILKDSKKFGKDYQSILCAAARQVLAGHKLVRSKKGELLYMSKECHSNGCINTVDVSYPAVPMFLLYAPELVKAMLVGIFEFAGMPIWKESFAPHDIGRYPLACGQVYSLALHRHLLPHSYTFKRIYKSSRYGVYMPQFQMPVEECGNMLLMSYAYFKASGDAQFLKEHYPTLHKWADYLKYKGIILDNQLCTDDFAGHSKKNVNLAIKAIMGLASFEKISSELKLTCEHGDVAEAYAKELVTACGTGKGYLPFSVNKKDSWSLKYNLVWDIYFGFGLFDKEIYKAESEKYRLELNRYGTPLDYRRDFTKTDWLLWASCLDESGENTELFSKCICDYLRDTRDRNCFTDWYETKTPKQCGFDHRTVQAGLWMPVLMDKRK